MCGCGVHGGLWGSYSASCMPQAADATTPRMEHRELMTGLGQLRAPRIPPPFLPNPRCLPARPPSQLLPGAEYVLLWASFGVIMQLGLEVGIGAGIVMAALYFSYAYARVRSAPAQAVLHAAHALAKPSRLLCLL